jgi:hypothetical protein
MACVATRRWKRHNIRLPIRVIVCRDNKTLIVEGHGRALSEGGVYVHAGLELDAEDIIQVEFTSPYSGLPFRVRGTVRNRKGYFYGVEFLQVFERRSLPSLHAQHGWWLRQQASQGWTTRSFLYRRTPKPGMDAW